MCFSQKLSSQLTDLSAASVVTITPSKLTFQIFVAAAQQNLE